MTRDDSMKPAVAGEAEWQPVIDRVLRERPGLSDVAALAAVMRELRGKGNPAAILALIRERLVR